MFKFKNPFYREISTNKCQEIVNSEPQYVKHNHIVRKEHITVPIYEEVTEIIIVKEGAVNQKLMCNPNTGNPMYCVEEIPPVVEEIKYYIITGSRVIQEGERMEIEVQKNVQNGLPLLNCTEPIPLPQFS